MFQQLYAVNTRNYVIPRLGGVTVEQDYEVMNQRRVIVASQALGFEELVAGATGHEPVSENRLRSIILNSIETRGSLSPLSFY